MDSGSFVGMRVWQKKEEEVTKVNKQCDRAIMMPSQNIGDLVRMSPSVMKMPILQYTKEG
jgi:hypothetical protein